MQQPLYDKIEETDVDGEGGEDPRSPLVIAERSLPRSSDDRISWRAQNKTPFVLASLSQPLRIYLQIFGLGLILGIILAAGLGVLLGITTWPNGFKENVQGHRHQGESNATRLGR